VTDWVAAIAHRGDPIAARENTPAAFDAAVAMGVDMVELDLRRTRDGEIVVLHDQSLLRLWGLDASVGDVEWAQVARIGTEGAGEEFGGVRIPLLREVLETVPLPLMVDFTRREVVEGALAAVVAAGALERSLFVTGNVPALRILRGLSAEARLGLTWTGEGDVPVALLRELGAEFWNPTSMLIHDAAVGTVHDMGLKVSCWTVDEVDEMARVCAAGVDAVVSNQVEALLKFLGRG
jgi:myo-inositol-1(or 4)-monophosphatase/deoxyribonuclease-2